MAESAPQPPLPLPPSPLVGRERELSRIAAMYEEGARLVTLRGAPGIGKSRLALAHAAASRSAVALVPLADITREDALWPRIGASLPGAPRTSTARTLTAALASCGALLLWLDDADAVLEALAPALDGWARTLPSLRVLLTARARTGLPVEHTVAIEPLCEADALALFIERAAAARGAPLPADEETRALSLHGDTADSAGRRGGASSIRAALVHALDRSPLALELAAARSHALTPRELLAHVTEPGGLLHLLVSPSLAPLPARARSVRDALGTEWALLGEPHRRALVAAALLGAPLTLADATLLLDDAPAALARTFAELDDRSLVRTTTDEDESRYELARATREFALEQLPSMPDAPALRARWAAFLVARAKSARAGAADASRVMALAPLRSALVALADLASRDPHLDPAADSFLALGALARFGGAARPAIARLDRLLAAPEDASWPPPTARAHALHLRALLHAREGATADALRTFERAAREAMRCSERPLHARILADWASLAGHAGDPVRATRLYEQALELFSSEGEPRDRALALAGLAALAHETFDLERAQRLFQEALAVLDDDPRLLATAAAIRQNHGLLLQESGDLEGAERTYREAQAQHRRAGHRRFEGIAEHDLGCLALERGEVRVALAHFASSELIATEVGDRREQGLATALSAACHAILGDEREAQRALERAHALLAEVGEPGPALALRAHGLHLELLAARQHRRRGEPVPERLIARVRTALRSSRVADESGDELRFALRILRAEAARVLDADRVIIARDGAWLALPGEPRVELGTKRTLARILAALLDAHVRRPEARLSPEALIRVGWPESRSITRSGMNRLHVAITALRKLGLSAYLVRDPAGYQLRDAEPSDT